MAATMEPEGVCSLTRFTEAWRRGGVVPDPTEAEWEAMTLHLAPAVGALVTEALARAGTTREELRQERNRRRGTTGNLPRYGSTGMACAAAPTGRPGDMPGLFLPFHREDSLTTSTPKTSKTATAEWAENARRLEPPTGRRTRP